MNILSKYKFITIAICSIVLCYPYASLFAAGRAVVLRSQNLHAYNLAIDGFTSICEENGVEIEDVANMAGRLQSARKVINKYLRADNKPDIFLAVGVLAATLAKKDIKDVPVVFCMVVNYQRFRLRGANISGISSEIPEKECFEIYKNVISGLSNVGVIYDPFKTDNMIINGMKVSRDLGLNLVSAKVNSGMDVKATFLDMVDQIDALWLAPDSTVVSKRTFSQIYDISIEKKVPILCTSDVFVKAGGLIGVFSDYLDIGVQAGMMALEILEKGNLDSVNVQYPRKLKIAINKDTEKKIKIKIPVNIYKMYDVVEYP